MPVPNHQPIQTSQVDIAKAVESALIGQGVISRQEEAVEVLTEMGLDFKGTLVQLGNLVHSGKEATRLQALDKVFHFHGVKFRGDDDNKAAPVININLQCESAQIQNNLGELFAPQR